MTDIVERLRHHAKVGDGWTRPVASEAADEIVRLREERDTARTQAANADAQCERDAERAERLRIDRDVWRNESIKKQAACEQMGSRIGALEAERDRMKKALQEIENPPPEVFDDGAWEICRWMRGRAEDALKGGDQ